MWFVADVSQCFNYYKSALDDKLDGSKEVFKNLHKFEKGDRITMRNVQGNHAMAFTGYNLDAKGRPISWQVENSWGYSENDVPGHDGFLYMSHSWFQKYVIQIAVHRKLLSRTMREKSNVKPIKIDPWDSMAPALRTNGKGVPQSYLNFLKRS